MSSDLSGSGKSAETNAPAHRMTNPVVVLLGVLLLAVALTYFVEAGVYQRDGNVVVPDTYARADKDASVLHLFALTREENSTQPVSLIEALRAIPEGLQRMAGLIFMVLIIGGMFGVATRSGAIDAALERLVSSVRGNIYVLVLALMVVFAAGATFLGLAKEYIVVIPPVVALANRLGFPNIVGLAIVAVPVKAGYIASVTNPLPLSIAQPLVGVQVYSGAEYRAVCLVVFLAIGAAYVLWMIRGARASAGGSASVYVESGKAEMSLRIKLIIAALIGGVAFLVFASSRWHWGYTELSAYYVGLSALMAALAGFGASDAADAFVGGMKKVLLAAMLIGVASAVAITLERGQVLDTIVYWLTGLIGSSGAWVAAIGMFCSQLMLDFMIPSTSGQAAVSMPIMGPLGQLSGVSPQTTVLAFLFGNGITNLITPTSSGLLAYLATAQVGWVQWAKAVFWLWLAYIAAAVLMLTVAVMGGY